MIRIKNLDLESAGMKRVVQTFIGDVVSGTFEKPIFAAPVACRVDFIDVYPASGLTADTSDTIVLTVQLGSASGSVVAVRGATASGVNSNNFVAYERYRLTPSANNSLSTGQLLILNTSAVCSSLSQVLVAVTYTPLKHRETE